VRRLIAVLLLVFVGLACTPPVLNPRPNSYCVVYPGGVRETVTAAYVIVNDGCLAFYETGRMWDPVKVICGGAYDTVPCAQ